MKLTLEVNTTVYNVDLQTPIDISIPLQFNEAQPNTYNVEPAIARVYEKGNVVGDTRRGGSCNFETYSLTPHCNGTHTECIGHITDERISIHSTLRDGFIPVTVCTITPDHALSSADSYLLLKEEEDFIITQHSLTKVLEHVNPFFLKGLVVRTLPNNETKKSRQYTRSPACFFSVEALHTLVESGVQHLLVDIPSLDRALDEGKLTAHRIFWNMPMRGHLLSTEAAVLRTVTEMIYVPEEIPDGHYLLNLQVASFVADAAPSRPILYRLEQQSH